MQTITIAIVADDVEMRQKMREGLSAGGFAVLEYDYRMVGSLGGIKGAYIVCLGVSDERGLAMLQSWNEREPEVPVIACGPSSITERALANGAYDVVQNDASAARLVREVKHAVEKRRLTETVTKLRTELTARDHGEGNVVVPLRELEHRAIARALQATQGSVTKAAKLLGIGRATLYRRLASPELANLRPRRNNNNSSSYTADSQPVHASM